MNPNERIEQQETINNDPLRPNEIITKTVQQGPREVGLSPTTIIVIIVLAVLAIGTVFYVVNNKNENEAANRDTSLEATRMRAEAEARAQQAAAQNAAAAQKSQPPVIIQQPAATQAPPVIIQQAAPAPTADTKNMMDDSTMQELASKRLADEINLSAVTVTVLDGKATLRGTVDSRDLKTKAEKIVKAVRGIKSVDNTITTSNQ